MFISLLIIDLTVLYSGIITSAFLVTSLYISIPLILKGLSICVILAFISDLTLALGASFSEILWLWYLEYLLYFYLYLFL